jgi:26S proteasome regulatory subunit T1
VVNFLRKKHVFAALDEGDIAVLKKYGQGPYSAQIKKLDDDIVGCLKRVGELSGACFG